MVLAPSWVGRDGGVSRSWSGDRGVAMASSWIEHEMRVLSLAEDGERGGA